MFKKHFLSFCFLVLIFLVANTALAQGDIWAQQGDMLVGSDKVSGAFGEDESPTDARDSIVNVIKLLLSFLALIFTLVIMWGGYTWMTSEGNQEKTTVAKKWLTRGVIGIAVILSALMIVSFVFNESKNQLN